MGYTLRTSRPGRRSIPVYFPVLSFSHGPENRARRDENDEANPSLRRGVLRTRPKTKDGRVFKGALNPRKFFLPPVKRTKNYYTSEVT